MFSSPMRTPIAAWVDGFLIDGLERAGVRCHREAAFALGVPRLEEFEKAVRSSARILMVLSPAYFSSETASFVDLLAQTYGLETSTWPVIPLRLEPVELPTRLGMLTVARRHRSRRTRKRARKAK